MQTERIRSIKFRRLVQLKSLLVASASVLALTLHVQNAGAQVAASQLPTGGSIAGGTGTINAPSGSTQVVDQTSSRMALTWSSFDIGSAATVTLNQPNTGSVSLNLVQGGNPTQIYGQLNSNGQFNLVNSNAVIVGGTSRFNTGGVLLTTLGTTASSFMSGIDELDAGGNTVALLSNAGVINAASNAINLIGGAVSNTGNLTATAGNINLVAADKVTLTQEVGGFSPIITGALRLALSSIAVENTGSLTARGGTVTLQARAAAGIFDTLIRNSGTITTAALSSSGSDGNVSIVAVGASSLGYLDSGEINAGTGTISIVSNASVQQNGIYTAGVLSGSIGLDASFVGTRAGGNRIATLGDLAVTRDLVFSNASSFTVGGSVAAGRDLTISSASGDLTVGAGGNLIAQRANLNIAGTTTVSGLVRANAMNVGGGGMVVGSGGVVEANGGVGAITVGNGSGSASFLAIGSRAGQVASGAGSVTLGEVVLSTSADRLIFNHTGSAGGSQLMFAPVISGAGSLLHIAGSTILSKSNSYSGLTAISGGLLVAASNSALGTTAGGTTVASGATLGLQGGVAVGAEALSLAGAGVGNGGALRSGTGDNSYGGAITLTAGSRINADAGSTLTLLGAVSGTVGINPALTLGGEGTGTVVGAISGNIGGLIKDGSGTWTLSAANQIAGAAEVNGGTLRLLSGGTASAQTIHVGNAAGSTGTISVGGAGSRLESRETLYVGNAGSGSLRVTDGGTVTNEFEAYLGYEAGSSGAVEVAGPGSLWRNRWELHVGEFGSGTLTIANGGRVTNGYTYLGRETGSSGTVTVTGQNSFWQTSVLFVGGEGRGRVTIGDGAGVTSREGVINGTVANPSAVDVRGTGSSWVTTAGLSVGETGAGTLSVTDGAAVTSSSYGFIGYNAGSEGRVEVRGQGSVWQNNQDLRLGNSGAGTLTVADGGRVSAGSSTFSIATFAGSQGTLNIGAAAGETAVRAGSVEASRIVFGSGTGQLIFNHTGNADGSALSFAPTVTGGGTVRQLAGETVLTGTNTGVASFTGVVDVTGGRLAVNGVLGDLNAAGGLNQAQVNVAGAGALGGSGAIAGSVAVNTGGTLAAGNSPGTLTVGANLGFSSGSSAVFELGAQNAVGNAANDLVVVGGNLTVGSGSTLALQTTSGSQIASGYYTLFDVGGTTTGRFATVTNGGAAATADVRQIVTNGGAGPNRYNVLLAAGGQTVQFFDGVNANADGSVNGGAGTWDASTSNWTTVDGAFNAPWQNSVGVFSGTAAGAVTVGGTQSFEALQFTTNGYTLSGGDLEALADPMRGVGSSSLTVDGGVSAAIGSVISGSAGIAKLGGGTLVLSGRNTYSGGTELAGGVLSISTNRNLGTASSGLIFSGGQLQATGNVSMSRSVSLVADGVIGITGTNGPLPNIVDLSGPVSGAGGIDFLGGGTLALLGTNTYAGNTTVRGGSLFGDTDAIRGNLANAGLAVFQQASNGTFGGTITGLNGSDGTMLKRGAGTLTLSGTSSLDWTADEGVLVSRANRFTGDVSISAGAGFVFDQAEAGTYAGTLSTTPPDASTDPNAARAAFTVTGGGTVMLSGDSSGFTGTSTIAGGSGLVVAGALGGDVSVLSGTLSGTSRIGGDLSVGTAGRLAGRSGEVLTIGGDLALATGSLVDAALGGVSSTALFDVGGDLVLDGTLNVSNAGGFGAGVYRLFSYRGSLTDNGLGFGTVPSGVDAADLTVQTAIGGRVNLVSSGGADLAFWDGGNAILHDNGQVDGGTGTWRADGRNWTSLSGVANGPFRPNPTFAVFQGTGGAVTVDRSAGAIGVTGMQFASDGYVVSGDPIALQGPNGESVIRVGDGSTAGASVTATIAATLTGNTSLVKDDQGTLVLSGTNAYTGGTQVRAGTLVGNAGSIRSGLANAGTVVFDEGGDAAFAGNIAGLDGTAGRMIKRGAGTLTLAGTSLLDWSVEAGQLVSSTSRFTGDLALVSGAGFTFNQTEAGIYAGTLSGRGTLGFAGGGSVQLTGDSSAYAGLTSVRDATLSVNGRLGGSATIGAGGVLKGTGTIGSGAGSVVTVASGGTLSPGNSPGTLNVNGDLVLASGSRYEVEVVPGTATSDRVVAAGTATLGGGTVAHVGLTGAYDPTATWTILSAAGGVSGTFGAVSSDFAFLDAALGYTVNDVTLTLSRNDVEFVQVGQTRNQRATAGALDDLSFGNALYDTIVGLDASTARSAFDQLSGEVHASVQAGLVEDSRFLRDAVSNRIEAAFGEARINDATTNHGMTQTNSDGAPLAGSDITAWLSAYGTFGEARGNGNAASLDRSSGGFFVGADAPVGKDSRLGLAAGYGYTDFDLDARQSYAHANTGSLGLYGSTALNAWEFDAGSAVSFTSLDTGRGVSFGTFSDSLSGETQAITAQVFGEVGYRFPFEQSGLHGSLKPFLGLAYVNQHTDGFGEEGGLASLSVESQSMDTTFTTSGLRAATSVPLGSTTLSLDAMAGWRHAFGDVVPTATASFADSSAFTVEGTPLSEDAAVLELGVGFALAPNAAFSLDYAGQFGSRSTDNGVKASLNVSF